MIDSYNLCRSFSCSSIFSANEILIKLQILGNFTSKSKESPLSFTITHHFGYHIFIFNVHLTGNDPKQRWENTKEKWIPFSNQVYGIGLSDGSRSTEGLTYCIYSRFHSNGEKKLELFIICKSSATYYAPNIHRELKWESKINGKNQ